MKKLLSPQRTVVYAQIGRSYPTTGRIEPCPTLTHNTVPPGKAKSCWPRLIGGESTSHCILYSLHSDAWGFPLFDEGGGKKRALLCLCC